MANLPRTMKVHYWLELDGEVVFGTQIVPVDERPLLVIKPRGGISNLRKRLIIPSMHIDLPKARRAYKKGTIRGRS